MKYISVREFRSKVSSYMGELPFTLTIYNKPVAVVSKYQKDVKVVSKDGKLIGKEVSDEEMMSEVSAQKKVFKKLKNDLGLRAVPKPEKPKKFVPWKKPLGKCQILECKKPAVEKVTSATLEGEDITKKLCKFHAAQARKERGY